MCVLGCSTLQVQQCPAGSTLQESELPFHEAILIPSKFSKLVDESFALVIAILLTLLHIFYREIFCDITFFSNLKESSFVCVCHKSEVDTLPSLDSCMLFCGPDQRPNG